MSNIQQSNTQFGERVMRRIYGVWFVRRLVRNTAKVVVLFGFAVIAKNQIWYAQVWENIRGIDFSLSGMFRYAISAFANTELAVQVIAVAGVALGAAFLWDVGRTIGRLSTLAFSNRSRKVGV